MARPAKKAKVIAGLGGAALGLLALWIVTAGGKEKPLTLRELAARELAAELQRAAHPKAVLLVSNPFSELPGRPAEIYQFQSAGEAGARRGLAAGTEMVIGFPKLRPEAIRDPGSVYIDPTSATPLSFLMEDGAFQDLMGRHPQCDGIISLVGLPVGVRRAAFWTEPGPPIFALLTPDFRMIGDAQAVRHTFRSGKLAAAVIPRPGAPGGGTRLGGDARAEFEKRFVVVTGRNVDEWIGVMLR